MSDMKKIYSEEKDYGKVVNIYETRRSYKSNPLYKPLVTIGATEYVIIHAFESKVGYAESKGGFTAYTLLLTDEEERLDLEKFFEAQRVKRGQEESKKWEEKFFVELKEFLKEKDSIPIIVKFDQKERFKEAFPRRTIWNSAEKSWALRSNDGDFDNLIKDPLGRNSYGSVGRHSYDSEIWSNKYLEVIYSKKKQLHKDDFMFRFL